MGKLIYRGHIPGLDVLRGLAILGVLCYHGIGGRSPWANLHGPERWVTYATMWGSSGVDLFFVLSGFLITGILLDSAKKQDYYRRFYFNRACRILPAYILILVVLKCTSVISWRYALACLLYIANMAKLVGGANSEYGAFWSLAVEEQFYLLWPTVVRRFSLKTITWLIPVYLVCAFLFRVAASVFIPSLDTTYKLWGNADWLFVGALVAVTLRSGRLHAGNIRRWKYTALIIGLLTLPVIVCFDLGVLSSPWIGAAYRWPIVLVYLAMLLWVIERNRGGESRGVLSFFGYISYGLYLVHPLVFLTLDRWAWMRFHVWVSAPIAISISVGIAYLSRRYFEEWFLQLKNRRARRMVAA